MPADLKDAKKDVYEAIRKGRLFIAHDKLCPARGFKFDYIADDGSDLIMGEEGKFQIGNLVVELPDDGEVNFIKNGKTAKNVQGREAVYRVTEKGVYRVEVYRRTFLFGLRPWIFSNPIYLR